MKFPWLEIRRRTKLAKYAIYTKWEWPNCVKNAVVVSNMRLVTIQKKSIQALEIVEISQSTHKSISFSPLKKLQSIS